MKGLFTACLFLIAAVSAQDYVGRPDRRVGQVNRDFGNGAIESGIIQSVDPNLGAFTSGNCRLNEEPSFDINNQVEWCSSEYNYCNDPEATCRLGADSYGTCCRPRTIIGQPQFCSDGSLGEGICNSQSDCDRFGRAYGCQITNGPFGTCCRRSSGGQPQFCSDGSLGEGICNSQSDCDRFGRAYGCQITNGPFGTCCRRSSGGQPQFCSDGSLGEGICNSQSDCDRFGRAYGCQITNGPFGTCCRRSSGGIRY